MSGRIGVASNATGTKHADLPASVAVVDLNSLVLQDVPTIYNNEYSNASSSLLFLNSGSNPSHTFASNFERNFPSNDDSASPLEAGTSSQPISVPVCLADRATLHYLLARDTQSVNSVANSLITGQAAYQKKRKRIDPEYVDFGLRDCQCQYCNALFWPAEQTKKHAKHTSSVSTPQFTACCMSNKVHFARAKPTPAYLEHLLNPMNSQAFLKFKTNIRSYNSIMALTSMGAKVDPSINKRRGPYVFKINGQVHHLMGSLLPPEGIDPKFAQLYIYDTQNEVNNRINCFNGSEPSEKLDQQIVGDLIKMLDECNEVVKLFRLARDRINEGSISNLRLRLYGAQSNRDVQYNLPTCDGIGGLIVGDIGQFHTERDIVVEHKTDGLQRITKLHPKYMALQYPLLLPYGEDGYRKGLPWNPNFRGRKPKDGSGVSMRAFFGYQIQDRPGHTDTLLKGGRLFQQYLVDAYATLEEDRLDFIRANQDSLRTEGLKGIHEALKAGNAAGSAVGKRVILPTSFTGSARYMINNYQDAMAICRQFGNPDLFITFTCNAKWPEIIEDLRDKPGCKAEDRPDLISRIFKAKLDHMIKYLKSGKPFGDVESVLYTVEFQKRGLPHCHILLWVKKHYKCHSPYDVDSIISAEIPDQRCDKAGYDAVSQYMIHGPCGAANKFSPCMKENKCSKKFPKSFTSETTFSDEGFVKYKRRDIENLFVQKNGIKLDNAFVVPYNRELLLKYQAHINVESCCQSMLIKYLFKYITKGADRARAVFEDEEFDEIVAYLNCRYLCPYEAVWRLLQFHIHFREPLVQRLSVHLPSDQNVVFKETDDLNHVVNNPNLESTMLTQWFQTNVEDPDARELSYVEFPTKYVWKNDEKQWSRRKKGRSLGRVAYVHPAAGELYYLRLLLNYQKGSFGFDHLRTVNAVLQPTFQAACTSLGLLGDDREWNNAMLEAVLTASSSQLRQLFVTLVLFCDVADPSALFETHWKTMCDDIVKNMMNAFGLQNVSKYQDEVRNLLLYELEKLFVAANSSLLKHHLPQPSNLMMDRLANRSLREELDYDVDKMKHEHSLLISQLNTEQQYVYNSVMETIDNNRSGLFFVHGHGGTGKTFLWTTIIAKIRSQNQIVLAVASSGIASLLLPGGRTAHSRFKIPINITDCSVCEIKKGTHLAKLIIEAVLILWDEAPMNHKQCFETLDRSLRDVLKGSRPGFDHLPFGGKPILFGGDFRQILPVVPNGSVADIVEASLTSSYLWPYLTIFFLKQNMRLSKTGLDEREKQELAHFAKWILDIGNGTVVESLSSTDEESCWVQIPEQFLIRFDEDPIKAMVSAVYTDFMTNFQDVPYLKERAIVTPRNDTAAGINDFLLGMVPGESRTYLSFDSVSSSTENLENLDVLYPTEFLNQLDLPGLPHHKLVLKVGTPVMLIRNLNQSVGLCNGTRLVVIQLNDRIIQAKIITGSNIGEKIDGDDAASFSNTILASKQAPNQGLQEKQEITIEKEKCNKQKCITIVKALQLFGELSVILRLYDLEVTGIPNGSMDG
ncbi:uncharacterized protein [Malus domestica]|uniref:uncharacterized protein n=1 Tax=Malus domestica TaxID=3750 RepID=UPI0039750A46